MTDAAILGLDVAKNVFQSPWGGVRWLGCFSTEADPDAVPMLHGISADFCRGHGGLRWCPSLGSGNDATVP